MFCGKCGVQNPEEAAFCQECGAPLRTPQPLAPQEPAQFSPVPPAPAYAPAAPAPDAHSQKFKKIGVAVVAGGAVVIILLVLLLTGVLGGGSYKDPINQFFKGLQHGNMEALMDSMISDEMVKGFLKESGMSKKEFNSMMQKEVYDEFGSMLGGLDLSDNLKYKIKGAEDLDKDSLEDVQDDYEELGVRVKAAKEVEVKVSIELFGQKEEDEVTFQVVQIGNRWYINPDEIDGF